MILTKYDYEKIIHFINHTHAPSSDIRKTIQFYLSTLFSLDHSLFWFADQRSNMYNLEFFNCNDKLIWDYTETYRKIDIMHPKKQINRLVNKRETVLKINETTTLSSLTKSDYYTYFKRHDIIDQMVIYFSNNKYIYGGIGFCRFKGDKPFTKKDRLTLQTLSIHLQQLVINALKINELEAKNFFLKQKEDHPLGIMLVDEAQDISFYNETAQHIIEKLSLGQTVEHFFRNTIKDNLPEDVPATIDRNKWRVKIIPRKRVMGEQTSDQYVVYIYSQNKKANNQEVNTLLSKREREIVDLVIQGYTNEQIANELWISINTVKKHLRNMYEKTNVTNRTSLIYKMIGR